MIKILRSIIVFLGVFYFIGTVINPVGVLGLMIAFFVSFTLAAFAAK